MTSYIRIVYLRNLELDIQICAIESTTYSHSSCLRNLQIFLKNIQQLWWNEERHLKFVLKYLRGTEFHELFLHGWSHKFPDKFPWKYPIYFQLNPVTRLDIFRSHPQTLEMFSTNAKNDVRRLCLWSIKRYLVRGFWISSQWIWTSQKQTIFYF